MKTAPDEFLQMKKDGELLDRKLQQLDYRGHVNKHLDPREKKHVMEEIRRSFSMVLYKPEVLRQFIDAIQKSRTSANPIPTPRIEFSPKCPYCGKKLHFEAYKGGLRIAEECPYKNGVAGLELTLNVPSGQMVLANDLRQLFPVYGQDDISTLAGMRDLTKAYEQIGMIHPFVGNTCPQIFSVQKPGREVPEKFVLGRKPGKGDKQGKIRIPAGTTLKRVASICTDLWWASIVDGRAFDKALAHINKQRVREGTEPITERSLGAERISCRPGTYTFIHYGDNDHNLRDGGLQTRFQRTGPATPEKNFIREQQKLNHTLSHVLSFLAGKWDDYLESVSSELMKKPKPSGKNGTLVEKPTKENRKWARMLDQMFFTLGNGIAWHPNGWGTSWVVKPKKKGGTDRTIPLLEGQHHWYPFSTYGLVPVIAGIGDSSYGRENVVLNPSFLDGLLNCLCNMVVYGMERRTQGRDRYAGKQRPAWNPDFEKHAHIGHEILAFACLHSILAKEEERCLNSKNGDPARIDVIQKWTAYLRDNNVRMPDNPQELGEAFRQISKFKKDFLEKTWKILPENKNPTSREIQIRVEKAKKDEKPKKVLETFELKEFFTTFSLDSPQKHRGEFATGVQLITRINRKNDNPYRDEIWDVTQWEMEVTIRTRIDKKTGSPVMGITVTDPRNREVLYKKAKLADTTEALEILFKAAQKALPKARSATSKQMKEVIRQIQTDIVLSNKACREIAAFLD